MKAVKLTFHTPEEGVDLLKAWDDEDEYIRSRNQINTLARRKTYYLVSPENSFKSDFSHVHVPQWLPLDGGPIDVVYLDPIADGGLPHTRGKRGIALPLFLKWHPDARTLRHEIVHLSQKQYPTRWWGWYKKFWNFDVLSPQQAAKIPERWRERRRLNPDTMRRPFVSWQGRYVPLCVFVSDVSPELKQCKLGFWDLDMNQWTWEKPPGWEQMFGTGFNDEHPHEIAAHWIDGSAGTEKQLFFNLHQV